MLNPEDLKKFINETYFGYNQFCIWKSANNNFVKNQDKWNFEKDNLGCKYKNFWEITLATLQQGWMLSISKLLDTKKPDYLKEEDERISVWYLLDNLESQPKKDYRKLIEDNPGFLYSNRDLRNYKITHISKSKNPKTQKAGVENFYLIVNDLIDEIIYSNDKYKDLNKLDLDWIEELSAKGVVEIFEKITK